MSAILFAYKVDISGKAIKIAAEDLHDVPKEGQGYSWFHLARTSPQTPVIFEEDELVDQTATRTLLAEDSRPRIILRGQDVLVNLRGVNLNPGSEPEDMIGIRFLIQPNRIVSIEKRPLKATLDVTKRMDSQPVSPTPGGFIATYAQSLIDRMTPTIVDLNEQVDDLEEMIENEKIGDARSTVSELRREAIMLRRYLAPQRDALSMLSQQQLSWMSKDDQLRIRDSADQATRVTEELDAVRERCAIVKDQLTDIRAEEMNDNMMILAVVSAVFLPLGLISGMMGINVGGMPWVENGMGFWYVCGIVVMVGIVQMIIFKLLKWI